MPASYLSHLTPPNREGLTSLVQVKMTATDVKRVDALVERLKRDGFPQASRSAVARSLLLTLLEEEGL